MVDFPLHDLNPKEFQDLVVLISRNILGIGTINFSEGKDSGKDARFEGTARRYPSETNPWKGKFIIQAKRKNNPLASCSDNDFLIEIKKEIPKIKKLRQNGEVDYYLIFTSRKLSAIKEPELIDYIIKETGVVNVSILAKEWITLTLSSNPEIIKNSALNKYKLPLRIFPDNIKMLITAFKNNIGVIKEAEKSPYSYDFEPNIDKKNEMNHLSKEYFELIERKSQSYFSQIKHFLNNPANECYQNNYYNIVEEINNKLKVHRGEYSKFEEVFEVLYDQLYERCPELRGDSRLIYVFLHFMYCNCDIGEIPK